jgi:hypothetical protein
MAKFDPELSHAEIKARILGRTEPTSGGSDRTRLVAAGNPDVIAEAFDADQPSPRARSGPACMTGCARGAGFDILDGRPGYWSLKTNHLVRFIMTDLTPTGGIGAPPQAENVFGIVAKAGPSFMARLQQLAEAHDAAEASLAQLKLGQEAEAAFKDAANQREAAKTDRRSAATELAKARQDAVDIRADAERERAAAQELRRHAEELWRGAHEKEQQAIQAGDAARQAAARADDARRKAEVKEKEFTGKIDRLKAALSKM